MFQTRDEDSIPETNLSFPAKLLFDCTRLLVSVVNPLTGRGRRVDAPRRVRSPQSRRSSKGATNNFLPLKTFTQPELNSSKLAASKVSILDKCSSVVYMLCIVRNGWRTLFIDTGNILSGRKTGKKRKMRKKLPRNLVSLFRANEFRLHVNPETGDGDSFRRDFSDWFSGLPRGRNYFAFTV